MARRTIKEVSDDLDKLVDKLELARAATSELEMKLALLHQKTQSIDSDLRGILSSFTWAWRTVLGVIITAMIAFVVTGGLAK